MKIRILYAVGIFCISSFCIFCGNEWRTSDRMEGFKKGIIRVYVRVDYFNKDGVEKSKDSIEKEITENAQVRCTHYLKNHIRVTLYNNEEQASTILKMIPTVVDRSNIRFLNCFDSYCEAFVDFDSKALQEELRKGTQGNNKK